MRKILVLMMSMILIGMFLYGCTKEEVGVCELPQYANSMEEYYEDLVKASQGETSDQKEYLLTYDSGTQEHPIMIPKIKQLEAERFTISVTEQCFSQEYQFGIKEEDNSSYSYDSWIRITYSKEEESFALYSSQVDTDEEVVFLTSEIAYWEFDSMHMDEGCDKTKAWLFNYEGHAVVIMCGSETPIHSFQDIAQYFDFEQYIVNENGVSKICSIDLSQLQ